MSTRQLLLFPALALVVCGASGAQETPQVPSGQESPVVQRAQVSPQTESDDGVPGESKPGPESSTAEKLKQTTDDLTKKTQEEVDKIAHAVDRDPNAKKAAAGILQPIYTLAQKLSFPAFHWLAFGLMTAGVVSFALQLVMGKLVVLSRRGFSLKEILSDAICLLISVVGLVLTTQAAAENSTFTQSAAAVLSATVLGVILGFVLYLWGQAQELQAVTGRNVTPPTKR